MDFIWNQGKAGTTNNINDQGTIEGYKTIIEIPNIISDNEIA